MNASKKYELTELVDLDLSRDEDSVTSLSFARTTDLWASAFAGINSSTKEQEAGRNQHLRSFLLQYPQKKRVGENQEEATEKQAEDTPPSKALGNVSYFIPTPGPKPETFQRILRLSTQLKENSPRLGVVATGLAPEGEIVIFAADTNKPSQNDIRDRLKLGTNKEAADLDITATGGKKGDFFLVYCTDYDIWYTKCYYSFIRPKRLIPACIQSIPFADVFAANRSRPKFRSIRFLTPELLLVLKNLTMGKGSELLLMTDKGETLLRKRLHKKIKSGTALSVSTLPFQTPGSTPVDNYQHAIAVAGADQSITILTLTHTVKGPYKGLKFQPHLFLTEVHPTSITSLSFSTHNPPTENWSKLPPQYIKLASTSIANTVVVHTLPLQPFPPRKTGSDTPAHYLLVPPGGTQRKLKELGQSLIVASIVMAFVALAMQALLEIQGSRNHLGINTWYNKPWEEKFKLFNVLDNSKNDDDTIAPSTPLETIYGSSTDPAAESTPEEQSIQPGLRDLLNQRQQSNPETGEQHIVIQHHASDSDSDSQSASKAGKVKASLHHPDAPKSGAKKWEDLSHKEKETWKERLVHAGEWAIEEGESVLKGVFFGGIAQGVGAMVGG